MTEDEFVGALESLVRTGRVMCKCVFCESNVTKAYQESMKIGKIRCDMCDMYIDLEEEVLYVPIQN